MSAEWWDEEVEPSGIEIPGRRRPSRERRGADLEATADSPLADVRPIATDLRDTMLGRGEKARPAEEAPQHPPAPAAIPQAPDDAQVVQLLDRRVSPALPAPDASSHGLPPRSADTRPQGPVAPRAAPVSAAASGVKRPDARLNATRPVAALPVATGRKEDEDPRETRRVSRIELVWGRWPGGLWLPVVQDLVKLIRAENLGGIRLAILLRLVAQWRFEEKSTRFPIETVAIADALGVARRTVSENIAALKGLRIIDSGGGFACNQTWVDLQQLRTRVSGTTAVLDGSPRRLRVFDAWGYPWARGRWFVALPLPIVAMMRKTYLQEEMCWLALFAAAVKYGRTERKVFPVQITKFAAGMCVPERSARRCLATLAAQDEAKRRPALLRKASDLPRGRWALDAAPLLDAVARWNDDALPEGAP